MVFSSPVFLFIFLPLLIGSYYALRKELRNTVLLVFSLVFYAWGETAVTAVLLTIIIANYLFGIVIGTILEKPATGTVGLRAAMALAVIFNVGVLGFFKYWNFIMDTLNTALTRSGFPALSITRISLPIGISFFTFHALSYVIDVYRRVSPASRNPLDLALYLALFPQLVAGPIIRYHDVAQQLGQRVTSLTKFSSGIRRFAVGLGKKVLIANPCGAAVDQIFAIPAAQLTPGLAWLGIVCYGLQIYYDFSGYSDMAIGLARMFGFDFLENFNYPYISRSIREFWRRWHISLSNWFRDYLYVPLGGNRVSPARTRANLLVVFFLCGLWHGASWTFVAWGLYHGMFLVLERQRFGRVLDSLWAPVRHAYTLIVVLVGWVLFRADTFAHAAAYLKAMVNFSAATTGEYFLGQYLTSELRLVVVVAIVGSMPAVPWLQNRVAQVINSGRRFPARAAAVLSAAVSVAAVVLLILFSAMSLATDTYNPFIYYRF